LAEKSALKTAFAPRPAKTQGGGSNYLRQS